MDLAQRKLSQEEWESLEVPVGLQELRILRLINSGYGDVNIAFNDALSLINHIKMTGCTEEHHQFLYNEYLRPSFEKIIKRVRIQLPPTKGKTKKPKLKKTKTLFCS